ncbi:hypothetical protein [Poriferisphaera sp. WC338]|uniref:hypothetical protein n=1 Tax=Poriferisphaera sp. WC338 TaxID=3425129 RepID=UPI003D817DE1
MPIFMVTTRNSKTQSEQMYAIEAGSAGEATGALIRQGLEIVSVDTGEAAVLASQGLAVVPVGDILELGKTDRATGNNGSTAEQHYIDVGASIKKLFEGERLSELVANFLIVFAVVGWVSYVFWAMYWLPGDLIWPTILQASLAGGLVMAVACFLKLAVQLVKAVESREG